MSLTKTRPLMMLPDLVDRDRQLIAESRGLAPGHKMGRITSYGTTWNYTLWGGDKVETRYMHEDTRPDWMRVITDAAMLGDHTEHITFPPPSIVVWFEVDAQNQLVRFIKRGQVHVS